MTLTLHLPLQLEQRLLQAATGQGLSLDESAIPAALEILV